MNTATASWRKTNMERLPRFDLPDSDAVWFWSERTAARPKNGRPLQVLQIRMIL
jgi:hypothetical protein